MASRIVVAQVFQNVSLNLAHIVHDNLCVVCDFSIIKGKCLRLRIVGENTFSNFCALSQSLTEGTVAVLDINRLDFISGRTNGFVSSRRSIEGMRTADSQLEELIVALVNTEQYHYGFEGTRELSIYQFNESVRQVIKKIDYDNKMHGIYAGTVSAKDLSQDDLNWLTHK